jgi:hypothetical protein
MRPFGRIVALSVSALLYLPFGATPQKKPIIVNGPTVVAFFPSVTDAELSKAPDTNEALADFQLYATVSRAVESTSSRDIMCSAARRMIGRLV